MNHEALLYLITVSIIKDRDELDIKLTNKLVENQHKLGLTFSTIVLYFGA